MHEAVGANFDSGIASSDASSNHSSMFWSQQIATIKSLLESNAKLQNMLETQTELVRDLTTRCNDLESRCMNGEYVWEITNYAQKRVQAIQKPTSSLHSPGFYTSRYGYKMSIRLNLNGVDAALGRAVSIFVHLMKGSYDDMNEWPFNGTITMMIIDQNQTLPTRQFSMSF